VGEGREVSEEGRKGEGGEEREMREGRSEEEGSSVYIHVVV
jgi:hypothetical protein